MAACDVAIPRVGDEAIVGAEERSGKRGLVEGKACMVPGDLLYTKEHLWLRMEGALATVGLTDYAQKALGEIAYVELPRIGAALRRAREVCAIESWKAAVGIDAPVSGRVAEVNGELAANAKLINEDCYGCGWIFRVELSDESELAQLLDPDAYAKLLEGEA